MGVALLGLLALLAAGCGAGASHASRSQARGASGASGGTDTGATTSRTAAPAGTTDTTSAPLAASGTGRPPPGLRGSTGYATYEMCSSGCSGGVSRALLDRGLSLPSVAMDSSCVSHQINGPVAPLGSLRLKLMTFTGSRWEGARMIWTADSSYEGPVLIRGRQLTGSGGESTGGGSAGGGGVTGGGSAGGGGLTGGGGAAGGAVGFGDSQVPYDELQLDAPGRGAATPRGTGREWFTVTRVKQPGCYFYQVDGTSFTETILFRAVG